MPLPLAIRFRSAPRMRRTLVVLAWSVLSAAPAALAADAPAEDPRLTALQGALADAQKMTLADKDTIAQLKSDLAASEQKLKDTVAKLQADQRSLLAANAKLAGDLARAKAKAPAALAPPADPRVGLHQQDVDTKLLGAQRQLEGDRATITQLQAQLTAARAGAETSPEQQRREALLTELQTALGAAQQADRADHDALTHAQSDLAAARGSLAQAADRSAELARAKEDLAAALNGAVQARATAKDATDQRDRLIRELTDARSAAAGAAVQLRDALDKLAAYAGTPDVAHQLADERGREELFKRRSAELSIEVDRLTAENQALAAIAPAGKAQAAPAAGPTALAAAGRWHVVQEGDTLTRISVAYYGTAARWRDIFEANRDSLQGRETLAVGQRLQIP